MRFGSITPLPNGTKTYTSITHEEEFVANETNNPFARICCKVRVLKPTLCDGTCLDCRKLRESYRITEPTRLIGRELVENGGDNDYIPLTLTEARECVDAKTAQIEKAKREICQRRLEIQKKVNARMQTLVKESQAFESGLRIGRSIILH